MPAPKASDLRHRVRFERRETVNDGMGNERGEWKSFGPTRKCKLVPTAPRYGNEQVLANRLTSTPVWDLTCYSDSFTRQLTTDDRAIQILKDDTGDIDGPIFNIRFIGDLQGNGRWFLMQVQEGVASG